MDEMDYNSSINTTPPNECFLSDTEIDESYNLTLHIVSIFVLLAISLLGASISVVSVRIKRLRINPIIINTGKFFGSGVVLATGFIHILPDAMETLTDPCLPESWNVYGAYAGLFSMLAVLAMQLIEFLAHEYYHMRGQGHGHEHEKEHEHEQEHENGHGHGHAHGHEHIKFKESVKDLVQAENPDDQTRGSIHEKHSNSEIIQPATFEYVNHPLEKSKTEKDIDPDTDDMENNEKTEDHPNVELKVGTNDLLKREKHVHHNYHESLHTENGKSETDLSENRNPQSVISIHMSLVEVASPALSHCEAPAHAHGIAFYDQAYQHKISTYLLEFGIALHSILIGLTLGTTGDSFVALFIALSFHQFFEAIALGAQIARLKTVTMKSAAFMVIFFSLTTPVGIAIGIGIHSGTYNPKSVSSLLVTGILDSLSAGVLIYVALVNLITPEMGANAHEFHLLSKKLKLLYFAALYLGAAVMAVIGRWA